MSRRNLIELARQLRGDLNGRWINIAGPRHSKRDRTLGILFDRAAPGGFWVHSLCDQDRSECRAHVKSLLRQRCGGKLPDIEDEAPPTAAAADSLRALAIWELALPPEGTPVESHLRARGCDLPPEAASVLRFVPACPFESHTLPAMIALMRDVTTGEPRGIHRTALSDDGKSKREMPDGLRPKRMMGPAKNAAAMLSPHAAKMGIAEGIETALSASKLFGLPVWAVLSAGGIGKFPVATGISDLTIFADNDKAGWSAAEKCGVRYTRAGIGGRIQYPPQFGDDWNDVLREHTYANDIKEGQAQSG